jgi:hypothetical protein
MPRKSTAVVLFAVVCLASVPLVGAAGALSVSVTQEGPEVFVEVTEGGEPVEDAKVSVSGVTTETPLDGEYSTGEDGRVTFDDGDVAELSGVIHLRISVEADGSYRSELTTLTRSPEVESPPLGQRMSVSLGRSVSETRGKVEGRMDAIRTDASQIRRTAEHVDETLQRLGNVRFEREVLGRELAAGDITASEFYIRRVEKAGEAALLRSSLIETVEHLSAYGDERLREEGVDAEELEALREELTRGGGIDTNRRILEEVTEER